MKPARKGDLLDQVRDIHNRMREHVGYLVSNNQHYTAVRLEAYADDLATVLEKGRPKRARAVR